MDLGGWGKVGAATPAAGRYPYLSFSLLNDIALKMCLFLQMNTLATARLESKPRVEPSPSFPSSTLRVFNVVSHLM